MNGKMGQQSDEVPLSGCNLPVPTAMGMDNELQTNHLEEDNSFWATVVPVDTSEDILEKLIPYAAEEEIFILGASGEVSYMELVNPPDAPVANTVLKGNFEISAIEGNIVWPKTHAKNKESHVTVLVAGSDGGIRGGPVRSLIAKSSIKVFVSTASKHDVHDMASEEYPTKIELPLFQFHDQAKRMEDVVDQIYKATLKELNQTITFP